MTQITKNPRISKVCWELLGAVGEVEKKYLPVGWKLTDHPDIFVGPDDYSVAIRLKVVVSDHHGNQANNTCEALLGAEAIEQKTYPYGELVERATLPCIEFLMGLGSNQDFNKRKGVTHDPNKQW